MIIYQKINSTFELWADMAAISAKVPGVPGQADLPLSQSRI
jgi:hypothetical protein